jgi:Protein of unknown function (DUF2637)
MTLRQLRRVRWAVRACLVLGVAATIAGNVLHAWDRGPVAWVIAGWAPAALLIAVELIARVPIHRRAVAILRMAATGGIGGIAAWVSYWHLAAAAATYGETGAAPYLLPLSVDGLVVVAAVSLVELGGRIAAANVNESAIGVTSPPEIETPAVVPDEPEHTPEHTGADPAVELSPKLAAVAAVDAVMPGLSRAQLAKAAQVSESTVAQYRRLTTRINGRTPQLSAAGGGRRTGTHEEER